MSLSGDAGQRMMLEYRAREAWAQRNYVAAQSCAEQWAGVALTEGDGEGWWNASHLKAEALRKQGLMSDSRIVADELASHTLTRQSAALRARVLTLRAFALQGSGDLAGAVKAARDATVEIRQISDHNDIAIQAQNALVASLAESGLLEDAWHECLILDGLLAKDPDHTYAGQSYWAIGNVAFLLKRFEDGSAYHRQAAKSLSPTNDLDLWARFNHGSAQIRLAAGLFGPDTLECIERAEMAMSITGATERDRFELLLTRAHWLVLSDQSEAAIERLQEIIKHKELLATHDAAQAHFLMGRALSGRGEDSAAVSHLEASVELFSQSGAEERAAAARELIAGLNRS